MKSIGTITEIVFNLHEHFQNNSTLSSWRCWLRLESNSASRSGTLSKAWKGARTYSRAFKGLRGYSMPKTRRQRRTGVSRSLKGSRWFTNHHMRETPFWRWTVDPFPLLDSSPLPLSPRSIRRRGSLYQPRTLPSSRTSRFPLSSRDVVFHQSRSPPKLFHSWWSGPLSDDEDPWIMGSMTGQEH